MASNIFYLFCLNLSVPHSINKILRAACFIKKFKINLREAAYVVAVQRVIEAMKLRGWV